MSARRHCPPTPKEMQRAAHGWNLKHPVGTKVTVVLDSGTKKETETISEAWVLGGHTAVILLDGVSGCYALSRVEARR